MLALAQLFHNVFLSLVNEDRLYFYRINQEWANSWFDSFMPFITDIHKAWTLILVGLAFVLYKKRAKAYPIIACCLISVALADLTAARIIKPMIKRPRPEAAEKQVRLLVPHQGSFGFPSNHAANTFAAATFLTCTVPGAGIVGLGVAALVAYSRVYVGVHYPLDVFFGGLLGILCGLLVFNFYFAIRTYALQIPTAPSEVKAWKKRKFKKNHG